MPWGIRTRDAAGNITLDITDRITRVIGVYSTAGNPDSGSFTNAALTGGTVFVAVVMQGLGWPPFITISGSTISWAKSVDAFNNAPALLVYGLY